MNPRATCQLYQSYKNLYNVSYLFLKQTKREDLIRQFSISKIKEDNKKEIVDAIYNISKITST
jgi:hypothetical protein